MLTLVVLAVEAVSIVSLAAMAVLVKSAHAWKLICRAKLHTAHSGDRNLKELL